MGRPSYNHTREDSYLTPCAECRAAEVQHIEAPPGDDDWQRREGRAIEVAVKTMFTLAVAALLIFAAGIAAGWFAHGLVRP